MKTVSNDFYRACYYWNRRKTPRNFAALYKAGFEPQAFPPFRIWRIFRNTWRGTYRRIEQDCNAGKFTVTA